MNEEMIEKILEDYYKEDYHTFDVIGYVGAIKYLQQKVEQLEKENKVLKDANNYLQNLVYEKEGEER